MKFKDIPGHSNVVASLRVMVDTGRIPHAIMLSGVSGIGKMKLARAFAQYIHCSNRSNGEPCGKCSSCIQHQSLNNPDVHYIYPVKKVKSKGLSSLFYDQWKQMLSEAPLMPPERWLELIEAGNTQPLIFVEESQNILDTANLSPFREEYKIFIIWQPENMKVEAANKLLKIIEEPYADTIFILVSNDDSKVLPTIYSRTRRFNLKPLSPQELTDHLMSKGVAREFALEAARISEGSLSKAEQIATAPDELTEFGEGFRLMMRDAYSANMQSLKAFSDRAAAYGRRKLLRFLDYCASMIRENFIYNLRMPQLSLLTAEEENFSRRFAPFIHEKNVEELNNEINRARIDVEHNANSKIVIFDLGLQFAYLIRRPKDAKK